MPGLESSLAVGATSVAEQKGDPKCSCCPGVSCLRARQGREPAPAMQESSQQRAAAAGEVNQSPGLAEAGSSLALACFGDEALADKLS